MPATQLWLACNLDPLSATPTKIVPITTRRGCLSYLSKTSVHTVGRQPDACTSLQPGIHMCLTAGSSALVGYRALVMHASTGKSRPSPSLPGRHLCAPRPHRAPCNEMQHTPNTRVCARLSRRPNAARGVWCHSYATSAASSARLPKKTINIQLLPMPGRQSVDRPLDRALCHIIKCRIGVAMQPPNMLNVYFLCKSAAGTQYAACLLRLRLLVAAS
jgi:hypothetical protein